MISNEKSDFRGLQLLTSDQHSEGHEIFFKKHTVREQSAEKPDGRTLFVLNIPPYVTENGIKHAFKKAGQIETVTFSDRPMAGDLVKSKSKYFAKKESFTFKVAYIVFSDVLGLKQALKLKKLNPLLSHNEGIHSGLQKWIKQYNSSITDVENMNSEIKNFMEEFDKKAKEDELHEKGLTEPDDDGWVTVTKKGRKPGFSRSENVESKIMEKMAKQKKELANFYTFQIRDAKMKHLASLRHKFEEDKKKIAQLRQSRKFRPF